MARKIHSNAWGESLSEEKRWEIYALAKAPTQEEVEAGRPWLCDWFKDVLPYFEKEGLAAPSRAGWYRFLGRMREAEAAKTVISVETSKRIAQGIARADVDPALAASMMTSLSVDAATRGNDEAAKILADSAAKYHAAALGAEKLRLEEKRLKAAEEQLKLAREKFEAAERRLSDARGALSNEKMTPEEQLAKAREILGAG